MANGAFIRLGRKISEKYLEKILRMVSDKWFDLRLVVIKTEWEDNGPVWLAYLPDSAPKDNSGSVGKAPGEDFGFMIALQDKGKTIYFRHHGLNHWESWARGCTAEILSEWLKSPIEYDATGKIFQPGVKRWCRRKTFLGWATRQMKKPLSDEDNTFIENNYKRHMPKGWES